MSSDENSRRVQLTPEQRQQLHDKMSVAIAERRHHDQIYQQSFVGGFVILGIYVVALDGVMARKYESAAWEWVVFGGVLLMGCALATLFYWYVASQRDRRDICTRIVSRVETILSSKEIEAQRLTNELAQTVITEEVVNSRGPMALSRPETPWDSRYLWYYLLGVGAVLLLLASAYWPAAQYQAEEPPVTTEVERCVEEESRQNSAGIRITMTGRTEDDIG